MKSPIKLGKLSLKLLYPLVWLILMIFESYAENNWYTKRRGNMVVSYFINSSTKVINIIVYIPLKLCYFKSSLIENVEEGTRKKQNRLKRFIKVFLLFILFEFSYDIIYMIYYVLSRTESSERKKENKPGLIYYAHSYGIFFLENLEIIFIFIFLRIFFKYEFTLQCIISLALFTIFSIIIDVLNYGNFIDSLGGFGIFMLIFTDLLLESAALIFIKYLIEKLFFAPVLANCVYGVIDLIFTIILGVITYSTDGLYCYKENPRTCYLANFMDYFKDFEKIDVYSLIASFVFKHITFILIIYIIYYLSPNHVLLVYVVGKFIENAMSEGEKVVGSYIVFIFLFITFIFYLEILELNFCGINKNTNKNIEFRALSEDLDNQKIIHKITLDKLDLTDEDFENSMSFEAGSDPSSPKEKGIGGYKIG